MSLLKLWNSLLGRPAAAKGPECPAVASDQEPTNNKPASSAKSTLAQNVAKSAVATVTEQAAVTLRGKKARKAGNPTTKPGVRLAMLETPATAAPVAVVPRRQPKVVTRGAHAEICRLAIATGATSILEIAVGDASRAEAVMQSLQAVSGDKVLRYAAIDQFEMVGGPITLKDFHHRMRGIEVRPQVFPEPVAQGLARFSRTVGFADLVIASLPDPQWDTPEVQSLVARITRVGSTILHHNGDRWQQRTIQPSVTVGTKKAA